MKRLILYGILAITVFSCEEETPVDSGGAILLLDTLSVRIVRDETPGFPYPRMYHELRTVARLSRPGFIITYIYRAEGMEMEISVDGARADITTASRRLAQRWSGTLLSVGQAVPVYVQLDADLSGGGNTSLSTTGAAVVEQQSNGPEPERGSLQLTGPGGEAKFPLYSTDGQRIFFIRWGDITPGRTQICAVNAWGGSPQILLDFYRNLDWLGWFTLADRDSTLVTSVHLPNQPAKLVSWHLASGLADTVSTGVYLHGHLADVPGTHFIVALSSGNASGTGEAQLVLIDRTTGSADTLAGGLAVWSSPSYGVMPGTRTVFYNVREKSGEPFQAIYVVHIGTRQQALLMDHVSGLAFYPAHDGNSYAALVPGYTQAGTSTYDYFMVRNGATSLITTYLEPEWPTGLSFSPDDRSVAIAVSRRGDPQIWKIPL